VNGEQLYREGIISKSNGETQTARERAKSGMRRVLLGVLASIACPLATLCAVLGGFGSGLIPDIRTFAVRLFANSPFTSR
jgi:hypothetical protein